MVVTQITVLANSLCIQYPVVMLAFVGFLGAPLRVVAVLAHSVGVIGFTAVAALGDVLPVFGRNSYRLT